MAQNKAHPLGKKCRVSSGIKQYDKNSIKRGSHNLSRQIKKERSMPQVKTTKLLDQKNTYQYRRNRNTVR